MGVCMCAYMYVTIVRVSEKEYSLLILFLDTARDNILSEDIDNVLPTFSRVTLSLQER